MNEEQDYEWKEIAKQWRDIQAARKEIEESWEDIRIEKEAIRQLFRKFEREAECPL